MPPLESMLSGNKPLISVITVVLNGIDGIEATILSVLQQRYENVEYIVIDGGSTDGTVEVLKKYNDRITWESKPDKGIYDAMNKGALMARGDWVNFMNCGDRFESDSVLDLFETFKGDVDVLYGNAIIEYSTFEVGRKAMSMNVMWRRPPFCHQAAFVRSETVREYPFDLKFRLGSDFDLFYRLYSAGKRFQHINKFICYYDLTQGASVRNQVLSLKDRRQVVLEKHFSIFKWIYFTLLIGKQIIALRIKKLLGKKITEWLTELLRK